LAESPKESRSTSGSLSFSSARPYQSRNFDFDLRAKHSDTLFYEDLVAAGVAAMWRAVLHFDSAAGYRFWTPAHIAVVGAISDEARLWRRGGSGEGKLDRWALYPSDRLARPSFAGASPAAQAALVSLI
jgi:hypothetical protein